MTGFTEGYLYVDHADPIQELDEIASEVYQTLDAALLDFWETEADMQIHQELKEVTTHAFCAMDAALLEFWSLEASLTRSIPRSVKDNSSSLIAAPCLPMPLEIATDCIYAGKCDLTYCNSTDRIRNFQDTLVDDTDQYGEKAMALYLVPPNIVGLPLPPPQPPPFDTYVETRTLVVMLI